MAILLQGPISVGDLEFDIHALVYSHLALVIGLQTVFLAVFVRAYATTVALLPPAEASSKWLNRMRLEHGLIAGLLLIIGGLVGSIAAVASWGSTSFEGLDPSDTMRIVIPSVTAVAIGAELVVASFVLGVLKLEHR